MQVLMDYLADDEWVKILLRHWNLYTVFTSPQELKIYV
jgi:hypothetical protein